MLLGVYITETGIVLGVILFFALGFTALKLGNWTDSFFERHFILQKIVNIFFISLWVIMIIGFIGLLVYALISGIVK